MPLTMSGVPSSLYSGRVPRLSVLKRQATSSLLKFVALIWSSGEYFVPWLSDVYAIQSPFLVLGIPGACPCDRTEPHSTPAATTATRGTPRFTNLDIVAPDKTKRRTTICSPALLDFEF